MLALAARELGGDAPNRARAALSAYSAVQLARALADTANFGPAKALFAAGTAAGYDMTSDAGIVAWVGVVNRQASATAPRARRAASAKRKPPTKHKPPARRKKPR